MCVNSRRFTGRLLGSAAGLLVLGFAVAVWAQQQAGGRAARPGQDQLASVQMAPGFDKDVTQGALRITRPGGGVIECPLKHTDVQAEVSGFIARVKVTQTFRNPTQEKIEAVYVFPLPHEAAVDDMTMVIGDRKIVGLIKRRAEARNIYEQALASGQTTALLEQERPNIFTQSVGNIEPDKDVNIEISYVDTLRYDLGTYEFHFPMVVGPRYNPGKPIGSSPETPPELVGKVAPVQPDTTDVPDASRISPPVMMPGYRSGHDVSLSVKLDAGVPVQSLKSTNHTAAITHEKANCAEIKLSDADSIPNKDFVLRYDVVGEKPEMALLAHTGKYSGDAKALGDGYFMLMIQPQEDERLKKSPPREVVFLVDVSGSMRGQPIVKAAECMRQMATLLRPEKDTFQLITFANQTQKLFDKAVPAANDKIQQAVDVSLAMRGAGGTQMLEGVKAAIDEPLDKERVRIVVMLTDGYIGNEAQIIEHVGKHCGDQVRFWCVGIGQSPNMFLVDGVAKQGGGMGKKLGLNDDAPSLAQEVMTRIQRAQLSKIKIDWGNLEVAETYPAKIPELWAGRPVILYGRYRGAGKGEVKISGLVEGDSVSWPLSVSLPEKEAGHDVLAKVWARQKIEDLMQQSFYAGSPAVEESVTGIALDYKLMSQYTSFVAVDEKTAHEAGEPPHRPRQLLVPVPLPEGTQWEGFFGEGVQVGNRRLGAVEGLQLGLGVGRGGRGRGAAGPAGGGGGFGAGGGGGFGGGGVAGARAFAAPMPAAPAGLAPDAADKLVERAQQAQLQRRAREDVGGEAMPQASGAIRFNMQMDGATLARQSGAAFGGRRGGAGGAVAARTAAPALTDHSLSISGLRESEALAGDRAESMKELQDIATSVGVTYQSLRADMPAVAKAAADVLEVAKKAETDGDLAKSRALYIQACLVDQAAANFGGSNSAVSAEALAALQSVQSEQIKAWTKERPELAKKLDLVIRDRSLEDAIADVARAAGLSIKLIPGSLDDAKSLCGETELRMHYLDLRHATVAEALDWLLQPQRMNWRLAKEGVVAGTNRRADGTSGWVYDVSLVALPDGEELQKLGDQQKAIAEAKTQAAAFASAVRKVLGLKDGDTGVTWFAPGQLLVIGSAQDHAKVEKLLAALAGGKAEAVEGVDSAVIKLAAERVAKRKPLVEKNAAVDALLQTAAAHDSFGWKLLAAAAAGQVDEEALAELQIAWRQPQTKELLKGHGRALVLRSAWLVSETSRAVPQNAELAGLAKLARSACGDAAGEAITTLEKSPTDSDAFASVLYAAMAMRDDEAYASKVLPQLIASHNDGAADTLAAARTIAGALLADRSKVDRAALRQLVESGVAGEDMTVLLAMACRRAGSDVWDAFRAAAPELLGHQALRGEIVVLINRLPQQQVTLAMTAR
jgi:Ca-activated chloride channel homolog